MDPLTAAIRYEHRRHAPKHAPCPHCGTPGVRKQTRTRTVRALAYRSILILKVTTAEYRAACGCCRTFRTHLEGVEPKAQYTNAVREAVLDRLLEDRMSVERLQAALRRDFLLDLSAGFVYDCLRWKVAQLDLAAHRAWTVEHFSGTLCVDELHLGRYTLLLATDPLGDFPVAFALVSSNDQDHLARFLRALRDHGLHPKVVVTDGSALYPAVLAQVWPQAQHQLCVFHVLQDLHRTVRAAIRRRRQQRAPRGRSLRGRRDAAATRRRRRRQEAQFVFRHRELILRRPEALSARQRRQLARLLEYVPALRLLRRFMDQVYGMLGRSQSPAQAWQRYARLQADPAFAADPDLAGVLAEWTAAKFAKMVAFLRSPLGARVRTNNHVERLNRTLRQYEKVRYRWRRARSVVRFVALLVDRYGQARRGRPGPGPRRPPAGGGGQPGPAPAAAPGPAPPEEATAA